MAIPARLARMVYRQAAGALKQLLRADASRQGGASVKALTLAPSIVAKKATYALTCETLRHLPILKELVAATDLVSDKSKLQEELVYVLIYDLLFGLGELAPASPPQRAVLARKAALKAALARLLVKQQVASVQELLTSQARSAEAAHPRYVRVNTLQLSVDDALRHLQGSPLTAQVVRDDLIPSLLVLPPGTDLHSHPLVKNGALILQGKASCMPAEALAPQHSWEVVDACAAPGNKTTQLAALMERKGRILACELNPERLKRLQQTVHHAGASNVEARHQDFLALDPSSPDCAQVRAILLDPSCSGSGTAMQRLDHLLPSASSAGADRGAEERLEQLARFQEAALRHALSFPRVERVVYSTCSVHQRENEDVVRAVLPAAAQRGLCLTTAFPQWPHRGLPVFDGAHHLLRTDATRDRTDGFFVALFARSSKGPPAIEEEGDKGRAHHKKPQRVEAGAAPAARESIEDVPKGRPGGAAAACREETPLSLSGLEGECGAEEKGSEHSSGKEGLLRRRRLKRQRKKAAALAGTAPSGHLRRDSNGPGTRKRKKESHSREATAGSEPRHPAKWEG